ncbi:MAG: DNA polymerase III subunit beta [Candidatus Nealsonbacteria bacterium CG_4_10_14_0_8_um_filter_35_10]|uniref:Beta sliding clamp n=2 Tax=Candidatus Nealsoniibacteriota TaxID=1817911 RepID=A0A2M7R8E4_9BACT|nr:MAG: DNA polymerase III subunit beta [Parcubacteria group bacterium CG1_02_36_42]PIY90848.1 MAG: DNA polymerase III subunit beta [Candidatus Nealsonbacteria bacterium CG_4_10_14_0_8_um_filter_35_10]PJB99664.1 MAG: DNA polymerase III subunit beta [Candidatus Nealsonbacteria bacterium CG_4_9_14_0_8_um_filter_35_12]
MIIKILQNKLKEGLNIIERITIKSLTLPILNNILIKTEKNFLSLSSTNLEIGIKWWNLAKIEKEGAIVIPSKILSDFIGFLEGGPIKLEVKDQTLTIETEKYNTKIKGLSPEEFPIIPQVSPNEPINLERRLFCDGLKQIVQIPILSSARPEISGVYLAFQKNLVKMVATDSFRLGEKKIFLKKPLPIQKEYSCILPQRTAKEIINIFGEKEGECKMFLSPNQILFESQMVETPHPEIQIVSKLIEGEYPDYQTILPQKFATEIVLNKNEFLNHLRAASIFASKINEIKLKTDGKRGLVEISSQNPDLGEYRSTIFAKIKGKEIGVSFNFRFLIDGLLSIPSPEVSFELNSEEEATILRGVDDQSYLYLAMPIKPS